MLRVAMSLIVTVLLLPSAWAEPVPPGAEGELGAMDARSNPSILHDHPANRAQASRAARELARQSRDFERHVESRRSLSQLSADAERLTLSTEKLRRDIDRAAPVALIDRHADRVQRDYYQLREGLLAAGPSQGGMADLRRWNRLSLSFDELLMVAQIEPKNTCSLEDSRYYGDERAY